MLKKTRSTIIKGMFMFVGEEPKKEDMIECDVRVGFISDGSGETLSVAVGGGRIGEDDEGIMIIVPFEHVEKLVQQCRDRLKN